MSISGISSMDSTYQTSSNNFKQIKQDFQSLSDALKSGDLSSAQQAFAQLQKDGGVPASQTQSNASTSQSNNLFKTLGSALQSGDLTSAQQVFSQIQQNMKAHHHHHHSGGGAVDQSSETSQAVSTNFKQIRQDFQSLSDALKSGDLSSAQQAFAQLQKDGGVPASQNASILSTSTNQASATTAVDGGDSAVSVNINILV